MPSGPLSLAAQLYLLAWDVPDETFPVIAAPRLTCAAHLPYLVRAGALTELAQGGLLRDADGVAEPVPHGRTGDVVLDGLLELMAASRPRSWQAWILVRAHATLEAVAAELVSAGYLRVRRRRLLGVFPYRQVELERPQFVEGLRAETLDVLGAARPVAEIAERDAALIALAAAGELNTLLPTAERMRHKKRIEALAERGATTAPALASLLTGLRAARIDAMSLS
ncbi:GOLPH3/VPS74 family protein [Streptomyces sp. NBC_01304]|uniref:GOLPH3/VPS74 family protein n=1 Tax=Streptomyces sp. NBC_01304 TaxID=2903818 RepID=UPI002E102924|nr:GPP34 family phosphoprotein [Streptomyces sp. NBC_01304]